MIRKFYKFIFIICFISLYLVSQVYAITQSGDPYQYIEPTMDPSYPKPGDKALVEQTVNGITVRIINLKKGIEETSSQS